MWDLISFACAGYVFIGIVVFGVALSLNNIPYMIIAVLLWIANGFLLNYANKKSR